MSGLSETPHAPARAPAPASPGTAATGRDRQHLFPGRPHVVKVRYADGEKDAVAVAAQLTGLRPGGFVGAAALLMARGLTAGPDAAVLGGLPVTVAWSAGHDQAVLTELVAARLALRRYGTLVNQAVAALHSGRDAPVWLADAFAGADRAVARLDAATACLARSLA